MDICCVRAETHHVLRVCAKRRTKQAERVGVYLYSYIYLFVVGGGGECCASAFVLQYNIHPETLENMPHG